MTIRDAQVLETAEGRGAKRLRHERVCAVRMALQTTPEQARILDGQSKIANWLGNQLLEQANTVHERMAAGTSADRQADVFLLYTKNGLRNLVPDMKAAHPFLRSVHSSVLKNEARRISRAVRDTRKSCAHPKGWPVFHRWADDWTSLEYDEPGKGYMLSGRTLALSLGSGEDGHRRHLDLRLAERPPAFLRDIRALRITRDHGVYYAVFTVRRRIVDIRPASAAAAALGGAIPSPAEKPAGDPPARSSTPPGTPRIIAFDPGHITFLTGVDDAGNVIRVPKPHLIARLDKQIDETRSRRDKCLKRSVLITTGKGKPYFQPSRRWRLYNEKLNELMTVRQDQTTALLYALANRLFREYDVVAVGDYAPRGGGISRGMRRSMNNRSLIGRFKSVCAWTAERSGKAYVTWGERWSTRTCRSCGQVTDQDLDPKIRAWSCPCGARNDRDENAAGNGLDRVMTALSLPCSGHREVSSRRTWPLTAGGIAEAVSRPERDSRHRAA